MVLINQLALCLFFCSAFAIANGQTRPSSCSAAFYPLTACSEDGKRSNFVQFDDCNERESQLRHAWFDISSLDLNVRTQNNQSLPATWKEVVIPNSIIKSGRLTVFYKRDSRSYLEPMQMIIPACRDL